MIRKLGFLLALAGMLFAAPARAAEIKVTSAGAVRGLMAQPKLLCLDEPAAGLNDTETEGLANLLRAIRSLGIPVVIVEHNMSLVMNVADRIVVLDSGAIIATGTPVLSGAVPAPITEGARQDRGNATYRTLHDDQAICAVHVHVDMPDRARALQVSNHLRPHLPVLLALLELEPAWRPLAVLVLLVLVQVVANNFVEPRLTAHVLNLSPLVVLFALAFWGLCWGVVGMVLAVPLTVMLKIVWENEIIEYDMISIPKARHTLSWPTSISPSSRSLKTMRGSANSFRTGQW